MVSVILPALNEASHIATTIAALRRQPDCEIIVVDGGSRDGTREAAAGADRMLTSPPGRARQMNHGAAHARGDQLIFLHADCVLAEGAVTAVERALNHPRIIAGCFNMRVQAEGTLYRCIDAAASTRVRLTGIVYGDQGLFLRRADFERFGGFPDVRLMEDVWLSRELRAHGRIVVLPHKIHVAARRWQRVGLMRQTLRNWTLTGLALAGVHPDRLARFYPEVR